MFLFMFLGLLIQCSNIAFCAAENTSRFPHLSRLPVKSLVRQKCLASENRPWFFKSYVQISCEDLEKKFEYRAQYPKCSVIDKSFISTEKNVSTILYGTSLSKIEKKERMNEQFWETKFREKCAIRRLYNIINNEASLYSYDDIATLKHYKQLVAQAGNWDAVRGYQSEITLLEKYETWIAEDQEKMEALYAGESTAEATEPAAQETPSE